MDNFQNILEEIHQRPGMFTGENTLRSIYHFLVGYQFAYDRYEVVNPDDKLLISSEFHDWVAYRLNFCGSTAGWCNMIYDRTESEKDAIDRFFELLAEFHTRKPHLVAKIIGSLGSYSRTYYPNINGRKGEEITEILTYPDSISLVTYTDDPGFFVYSDAKDELPFPVFFSDIEMFEILTGIKREQITVVDPKWSL